jgi:DNA polymerase elongation subunit (family B)
MSLRGIIEHLVRSTDKNNSEIYKLLNRGGVRCSKRTIRRYANPIRYRERSEQQAARILLFDIETAPMEVYVWSLRQHGWITPEKIKKSWSVLCWSAKWLFEPRILSARVYGVDAHSRDDRSIIDELWGLLDEADIVISHNGARFDVRRMNARFAVHGMRPPMPYRIIDTLRVAKRQFDLPSYKLDYVNGLFGLERKEHTEFELWKRCVEGDEAALKELSLYCENDVRILEELYLQIRPWIKGHPNVAMFIDTDKEMCTNCGSAELAWKGKYFTPAGRYKAFRCLNPQCGAIGRSRYSDLTKEDRQRLHISVAQ